MREELVLLFQRFLRGVCQSRNSRGTCHKALQLRYRQGWVEGRELQREPGLRIWVMATRVKIYNSGVAQDTTVKLKSHGN